jgi:hypothetical protein
MTGLLIRLVGWALLGIARLVAAGLVLLVRVLLGLLALVGLRGARLGWLVATVAGVAWAAQRLGLRSAVALAALAWLVWATRRPRAQLAQRGALRRLTRALEAHTSALRTSALHHTHRSAHAQPLPGAPVLAAGQSPEQAWRALERYAAAWTRRHTQPAPDHHAHHDRYEDHASVSDREGR